jgi:pyridoxal phosphate enzyme (YggS family)
MTQPSLKTYLRSRFDALEERIRAACQRAARSREAVTLVAVTKTVTAEVAALAAELGYADLAENRPQELWRKAAVLPASCRWHLIGHLQRNKVERTLRCRPLIHSVDSVALLTAIDQEAARRGQTVTVLLEVNASREPAKHGFAPEEVPGLVATIQALRHVQVRGLMTMARFEEDPQNCRPTFALVRELQERFRPQLASPHRLDQLSMGMTNDFEVAIEEGATMIRVGSALFEGLDSEKAGQNG